MRERCLNEDRLPQKLSVVTSNYINNTIEAIDTYKMRVIIFLL